MCKGVWNYPARQVGVHQLDTVGADSIQRRGDSPGERQLGESRELGQHSHLHPAQLGTLLGLLEITMEHQYFGWKNLELRA